MFTDKLVAALVAAAQSNAIEPPALCALVEVETSGAIFESDGRTPQLLYERHKAWEEAGKVSVKLRSAFANAGLAHQGWHPATQYKDQGTSAKRLDLIARARRIDEEVADRASSWGVGQTMGFLAEEIGFGSAVEMVAHMTGSLDGQIDCMIRELHKSHLVEPINAHDWAHVARIYNGKDYAANRYDVKLADAYKRWTRRLATIGARDAPPEQSLSEDQIRQVQRRLDELGYHEVGTPDGRWGSKTLGAVSAFQAHEGLPHTGHYDDATRDALNTAEPREVSPERAGATAAELAEGGSRTVTEAQKLTGTGQVLKWLGISGTGAAGADSLGWLDTVKSHLGDLKPALDALGGAEKWLTGHWFLIALGLGLFIAWRAQAIVAARVEDHQTGRHSGAEV